MAIRFDERAFGLDTPKLQHVHRLLNGYSEHLSLRRIQPDDPVLAFSRRTPGPPHEFGVWEDNVAPGQRNWVFTVPEMSVDDRLLARIMENDMRRKGADERMARMVAHAAAVEMSKAKKEQDRLDERHEEQVALGKLFQHKDVVRHTFADGRKVIIGDELRDVRTTPKANVRAGRSR